jgi:uncharacterized membrane protein
MNYNIKKEWPLLVILAIPFVIAVMVYPRMPEQVPIHWNIEGQVKPLRLKEFGTFLLPLLNIAMYVLFLVMPKFDRNMQITANSKLVSDDPYSLHLFFMLMFGVTVAASLGYPINIGRWVPAGVAELFIGWATS